MMKEIKWRQKIRHMTMTSLWRHDFEFLEFLPIWRAKCWYFLHILARQFNLIWNFRPYSFRNWRQNTIIFPSLKVIDVQSYLSFWAKLGKKCRFLAKKCWRQQNSCIVCTFSVLFWMFTWFTTFVPSFMSIAHVFRILTCFTLGGRGLISGGEVPNSLTSTKWEGQREVAGG